MDYHNLINTLIPSHVTVSSRLLLTKNAPMFGLKGVPANIIANGNQQKRNAETITPTIIVILQ